MKVLVKEPGKITPATLCTLPREGDEFVTLTGERVTRPFLVELSEGAVREVLTGFSATATNSDSATWNAEVVLGHLRWIASVCAGHENLTEFRLEASEEGFKLIANIPGYARDGRRQVGIVHVDSAAIIVTDPGYIARFGQEHDRGVDLNELATRDPRPDGYSYSVGGAWEGRCNTHGAGQMVHGDGRPGAGVVVESGLGDGEYPVFVDYDEETGRVSRLIVEFL